MDDTGLHHRQFLFVGLPVGYRLLSALILVGYVTIVWSHSWTGLAGTVTVATRCKTLDLVINSIRKKGGWCGYLHHELIYLAVPAFAFTDFLKVAL